MTKLPKMICGADGFQCATYAEIEHHMAEEHGELSDLISTNAQSAGDGRLESPQTPSNHIKGLGESNWKLINVLRVSDLVRLRESLPDLPNTNMELVFYDGFMKALDETHAQIDKIIKEIQDE